MRKRWIITTTTAGVVALGGLAVAGPALADDGTGGTEGAVERIAEALTGLVDDGSLTQEQADEVATTLAESGLGGPGGRGGHGSGPSLTAAAEALGMTVEDLRTALEPEGTTLAQVAEDQGVEVAALVDALVAAEEERIADAVADGRMSQAEADARLADVEDRVTERVTTPRPDRSDGAGRPAPGDGD